MTPEDLHNTIEEGKTIAKGPVTKIYLCQVDYDNLLAMLKLLPETFTHFEGIPIELHPKSSYSFYIRGVRDPLFKANLPLPPLPLQQ